MARVLWAIAIYGYVMVGVGAALSVAVMGPGYAAEVAAMLVRSSSFSDSKVLGSPCSPEATTFNHSLLDALLRKFVLTPPRTLGKGIVNASLFDYTKCLASPEDLSGLDAYAAALAVPDAARCLPKAGELAFWVNAYNALIIRFVLHHAQNHSGVFPTSIRDLGIAGKPVWDREAGVVAGEHLSFQELEGKAQALGDPRIHAALNCASMSCPDLKAGAYDAASIDTELEEQVGAWLRNPTKGAVLDLATGGVTISPIFEWHSADFGSSEERIKFLSKYIQAPEGKALFVVGYLPYDWRLAGRGR